MTKCRIGLIDYNNGNLGTLKINLNALGFRCVVSNTKDSLQQCDVLILPGVGAFGPAMLELQKRDLDYFLIEEAARNKPIIGICLGMQLLAKSSTEKGYNLGLGIIPHVIEAFPSGVSHIGWNSISLSICEQSFMEAANEEFFFNHSYAYMNAGEFEVCKANIKGHNFVAALRYKNVVGLQFHPEKSQKSGLALIKRIIQDLANV